MKKPKPEMQINKLILIGIGILFILLVSCPTKNKTAEKNIFHPTIDYRNDESEIPLKSTKNIKYHQKKGAVSTLSFIGLNGQTTRSVSVTKVCENEIE